MTERGTYPGFEGTVGRTFAGSQGAWPARPTPPAGAPNVIVMLADDLGFADLGLLRIRDRHPAPRRARVAGCPLHQLPRRADVLADARRAAHRARVAPRRLRNGCAPRPRIPGLRDGARSGRRDDRGDPAGPGRLRHDDGGEVAPREGLGLLRRRSAALVAVPTWLRPLLRNPRRVHEPAPAAPPRRGQPPRRGRPVPGRLLLHRRPHRPRDLDDPRAQGEQPRAAVLPVLRARRGPRAAARAGAPTSRSTAGATTVAGTSCGRSASRASRSSASCPRAWSCRPATPRRTTTSGPGTTSTRASGSCSRGTWRSTRRWSTASTRTSAGWWASSRRSASSTTRSSCSSPTTARPARAR